MLKSFRKTARQKSAHVSALPAGRRVYAVGDIHGRRDLLETMIAAIEKDCRKTDLDVTVILLGDLVDRGPDSAGVLKLARKWRKLRDVRILMGNHEEMFLASFNEIEVLKHFLRFGGRETLLSYGLSEKQFAKSSLEQIQSFMRKAIPPKDIAFMQGFEDMLQIGDYLFVHAGIDPQKPLTGQTAQELHWIRTPFLDHDGTLSHVVVHGHTICEEPEERPHRIGIDTGAFRSGRLTALVLEGTERAYIEIHAGQDGAVKIKTRKAA